MGRGAGIVMGAAAIAAACEWAAGAGLPGALGDAVPGAVLLGCGASAALVPRGARCGTLMVACGVAWLAGTLSGALVFVHRGPLVQLVLAYPRAAPLGPAARVVTAAAYVCSVSGPLARSTGVTLVLVGALLLTAALRYRRSAGVQRRALAVALAAAMLVAVAFAAPAVARGAGGGVDATALWVYELAVTLVAVGLAIDVRWGRWTRAAVAELVADLGSLQLPGGLHDRLARALGDPDLVVAFGDVGPRDVGAGRVVTDVVDNGRRVGVLVHDTAVSDDPRLLDAAVSVARLAAANAHLQREVTTALSEVAASRRRLVEAGIEQRRRLEAELRAGAERRLAAVAERLDRIAESGTASVRLAEVAAGLARARENLQRFAQGVHPRALTEHGLAAALGDIADTMPLRLEVDVRCGRLGPNVEAAAYFLCAEALANVGKHAQATTVTITIRSGDAEVAVTISDDGVGGADVARGSGLRGLADRIQALDGTFQVHSPGRGGTRLEATIPL
jgi:signal transduction histidine kinase